jgi:hypothetical protein
MLHKIKQKPINLHLSFANTLYIVKYYREKDDFIVAGWACFNKNEIFYPPEKYIVQINNEFVGEFLYNV